MKNNSYETLMFYLNIYIKIKFIFIQEAKLHNAKFPFHPFMFSSDIFIKVIKAGLLSVHVQLDSIRQYRPV